MSRKGTAVKLSKSDVRRFSGNEFVKRTWTPPTVLSLVTHNGNIWPHTVLKQCPSTLRPEVILPSKQREKTVHSARRNMSSCRMNGWKTESTKSCDRVGLPQKIFLFSLWCPVRLENDVFQLYFFETFSTPFQKKIETKRKTENNKKGSTKKNRIKEEQNNNKETNF